MLRHRDYHILLPVLPYQISLQQPSQWYYTRQPGEDEFD